MEKAVTTWRQDEARLIWQHEHETVQIEAWGPDSLRVRATLAADIADPLAGIGALLEARPATPNISVTDDAATIRNGAVTAHLTATGALRFTRSADGIELLAEQERHFVWPPARHFEPGPGVLFRIEANFKAYDDERIYGLGQHQHGRLNLKGCVIDLIQRNTHVTIPFLLSSRGYGFLWHNPAVGRVELGLNGTRWVAEAGAQIDYWITAGDTPAAILERYTAATGRAPMLPEWAAGFWQSNLRYRSQDEVLAVAREYRQRGLPLDIIVIDAGHWTLMGDWQFDPAQWPDPLAMARELRDMGIEAMVSVWPTINGLSRNFRRMRERGWLARTARGGQATTPLFDVRPEGPVDLYLYDATHPDARRFIWERLRDGYYRHGIRLFWLDGDEPEIKPIHPDNLRYHLGHGAAVHNIYPLLHARAIYDGLRDEGEDAVITLNRSAWAGSQRYGAAVWSGDVDSTFEALQAQVRAGLNIGLSGIPWWTTDIGGFKGGDPADPYFRELIVRWFQYGVFCPLFRLHGLRQSDNWDIDFTDLSELTELTQDTGAGAFGLSNFTGAPNEVWSFGEEAYGIIRELLFLRERLRPYVLAQMRLAHERGIPPMRPLFVDFPSDAACRDVDDQFMFGPDLLVAPVLHHGARERDVYLPDGAIWRDAWSGETLGGGRRLTAQAPLDRIPLYLRDGAHLPVASQ